MAKLIFEQICGYAGMQHWPFKMVDQAQCNPDGPPHIRMAPPWQTSPGKTLEPVETSATTHLEVPFDAHQSAEPEALIASYAHILAHHLGSQADSAPPGGQETWAQATEILAIYMGFGVMFANSAFTFKRGGCGGCGGQVERLNALSQYDTTYALALFCTLKEIPTRQALAYLKKPLRPFFKRAMKEIAGREEQLLRLKNIKSTPQLPVNQAPLSMAN